MGAEGDGSTDLVADRKKTTLGVIQKLHVHAVSHSLARRAQASGGLDESLRGRLRLGKFHAQFHDPRGQLQGECRFGTAVAQNITEGIDLATRDLAPKGQVQPQIATGRYGRLSQWLQKGIRRSEQHAGPRQIVIEIIDPILNLVFQLVKPISGFAGSGDIPLQGLGQLAGGFGGQPNSLHDFEARRFVLKEPL